MQQSGYQPTTLESQKRHSTVTHSRELLRERSSELGWPGGSPTLRYALSNEALSCLGVEPNNIARGFPTISGIPAPTATRAATSIDARATPAFNNHQSLPLDAGIDWDETERVLSVGYGELRLRARNLLRETRLVPDLHVQQGSATLAKNHKKVLEALADGRISSVVSVVPQRSARITAGAMEDQPERALDILVADLVASVHWLRSQSPHIASSNSFVRDAIAKRIHVFNAVLPDDLQKLTPIALMHLEHEELGKAYANRESMLRLPIADIPRESFWVTEDGFAWEMDELAQALIANGGEMRNPINHRMFSNRDVQAIHSHPMTKNLDMSQRKQPDVRISALSSMEQTIDKLDELANTMVSDISADRLPSRKGLEEFLVYLLRLPKSEQNSIDELQLPGVKFTLAQLIEAALAGRFSLFRTGDLIEKAAESLRQMHL